MAGPRRLRLDDPPVEVTVRRSAAARRITLTVPATGEGPRLTAPKAAREAELRLFLVRQADWLRAALERAPAPRMVAPGAALPVSGRLLTVEARPGPRRPPAIEGERLALSGAGAAGPRIAAWLKMRARAALAEAAHRHAATLGAKPGRLSLRDTKGRWGSCTSRGDLSFSWRLAMAPPEVLDYVAAHEAAHLIEMNHGPRFWALVEKISPDWRRSRDWLKREGAALHLWRFEAA